MVNLHHCEQPVVRTVASAAASMVLPTSSRMCTSTRSDHTYIHMMPEVGEDTMVSSYRRYGSGLASYHTYIHRVHQHMMPEVGDTVSSTGRRYGSGLAKLECFQARHVGRSTVVDLKLKCFQARHVGGRHSSPPCLPYVIDANLSTHTLTPAMMQSASTSMAWLSRMLRSMIRSISTISGDDRELCLKASRRDSHPPTPTQLWECLQSCANLRTQCLQCSETHVCTDSSHGRELDAEVQEALGRAVGVGRHHLGRHHRQHPTHKQQQPRLSGY